MPRARSCCRSMRCRASSVAEFMLASSPGVPRAASARPGSTGSHFGSLRRSDTPVGYLQFYRATATKRVDDGPENDVQAAGSLGELVGPIASSEGHAPHAPPVVRELERQMPG